MVQGSCYCGAIKYEAGEEPRMTLFCHCVECRKAHGAPYNWIAMVPLSEFSIIKGSEFVRQYKPSPEWDTEKTFSRSYCVQCGSKIWNEMTIAKPFVESMPAGEYRGVFPAMFDVSPIPLRFKPTAHIYTKEAITDLQYLSDGLPRFSRFPGMPED